MGKDLDIQEIDTLLFGALNVLLQSRSIDKISVNEIIIQAGISRSTFYRHYYDKYDLLNSCYEKIILKNTLFLFNKELSWFDAVCKLYKEIKDNLNLIQNAFRSTDLNNLKNYIYTMSMEYHMSILKENGVNIQDWKVIRSMEIHIYGTLEVTYQWVMNGMQEPIEEMIKIFNQSIPAEFKKFFASPHV